MPPMRRPATRWGPTLLWLALGGPGAAGCDFFRELESAPGATSSGSGTDSGTGTEGSTGDTENTVCSLQEDDRCLDQDTVASCGLQDGRISEVDCVATCGGLVNFSCVLSGSGQHACWCVEPGANKVLSCSELEDCMEGCDLSQSFECADRCFSRTNPLTVRVYGALVHCAEETCQQTCVDSPQQCAACIDAARIGGGGGCSLPRAICDDDRNEEDPWG